MAVGKSAAVAEAVDDLHRCMLIAGQLISRPDQEAPAVVAGGSVTVHSSPPWNPGAAFAHLDIFYGVRDLEQQVRLAVTGQVRTRGHSDANTREAMIAIARLAEAVDRHERRDPADKTPCQCGHCRIMRQLFGWRRSVEILAAVDEAPRWSVIRTDKGEERVLCPYCKTPSLRAAARWKLVSCGNPECVDGEGNPPVGEMRENAQAHGEGFILWGDGLIT